MKGKLGKGSQGNQVPSSFLQSSFLQSNPLNCMFWAAKRGSIIFQENIHDDQKPNVPNCRSPLCDARDSCCRRNGKVASGRSRQATRSHAARDHAGRLLYAPARGQMWDTWLYFHDGKYYMYYLAGPPGHWDGHELATSDDGVHWKEYGVVVRPRTGVTWMGTGHIWKAETSKDSTAG